MHEFSVWAPQAKQLSVKVGEVASAMSGPDKKGWWTLAIPEAGPGTDYAFLIDHDETPYPDPRSLWQPNGVHSASRVYDKTAFVWHDPRWQGPPLTGAVIYELHVGTFTPEGTFDAAAKHLKYLAKLGITHIELMPIASFAGGFGWGYDGVALFSVHESYGGPDALKRFVDSAHRCGIAVLLDVVYNHFGPVGAYAPKFGPYLNDRHRTPWGDAINFEVEGSDEVRRFFIDNALLWMRDYHIDGLRLDAVHEFMDRSAVHFMEQLSAEVEVLSSTLGRRLVLIAESDLNDPKVVRPREASGYGIDAQWSDDFHHSLFTILHTAEAGTGYYDDFGTIANLAKSLKNIFVYDGIYSSYRARHHGRPINSLSAHHFIGFIQNHDQIGNRAVGDRLEQILGMDLTKVALALTLTAPFIPMLFQGEEYAASTPFQYFAHHDDEEMARAVSAGRKREFAAFGWDPDKVPDPENPQTFEDSKLNWSEVSEGKHAEMLDFVTRLIHLRRCSTALNDGDLGHLDVSFSEADRWLVMDRREVRTCCNFSDHPVTFDCPDGFRVLLSSDPSLHLEDQKLSIKGCSVAILSAEKLTASAPPER